MSGFCVKSLSLAVVALSMSSCAVSYCSDPEHQADAMCQLNLGGSVAAFTITPARISINKDAQTAVTISAYSSLVNMLATLKQSGGTAKPIPLGNVRSDGTLTAMIRASDLSTQGFLPGPAEVEIANQKLLVRIFVAPKFDSSTFSAAQNVSNDHGVGNMAAPSWVGVQGSGAKKILTLDRYAIATIAKQAIGEYTYDPANRIIKKASPLLFSAYNSIPYMNMGPHGLALSMSDFVVPEFGNASTSLLTQCSVDGSCSGSVAVPYGTIASMSAAFNGQLYAGIFNDKLMAFSDASLMNSVALNGTLSSAIAPAFVIVQNTNGDDHPDVSVWHGDGKVSLALADSAGKNLAYDATAAESIKSLGVVGTAAPDAVAAGDLDQDGLDDFVIVKGGSIYVLSNLGAGRFSSSSAIAIPAQGSTGSVMLTPVSAIAIGDVSADDGGLKDLVLVSKTNHLITVMENGATLR